MRLHEDGIPLSEATNYLKSFKKVVYERLTHTGNRLGLDNSIHFPILGRVRIWKVSYFAGGPVDTTVAGHPERLYGELCRIQHPRREGLCFPCMKEAPRCFTWVIELTCFTG